MDLRGVGEIAFTSIDEFVEGLDPRKVDFIKLDVEGWEFFALVGAFRTIRKDRPVLMVEINEPCLRVQGTDGQAVKVLLQTLRYVYQPIQEQVPEGGVYDLLCLPVA